MPLVEIARNLNAGLAVFSWPFVVFDSLSKRVDVTALKDKLDLRDAQLMALVIAEAEAAILPFLWTSPPLHTLDIGAEDGIAENEEDEGPVALGDNAKDALARLLRKSEVRLNLMYTMRCLPQRILRLNGYIYRGILCLALLSTTGATLEFLWPQMPNGIAIGTLIVTLIPAAIAVVLGVIRQMRLQNAEQSIIDYSA